ncbi:hypothetical protein BH11ARM2_BH11ARM2_25040 [soil metagenome]
MSFIKDHIAQMCTENPEYREAYEEEVRLQQEQAELRVKLMKQIVSLRKQRRLTQVDLAGRLHVSQARVSQIEKGAEPVGIDSVLALLKAVKGNLVILSEEDLKKYGLEDKALIHA